MFHIKIKLFSQVLISVKKSFEVRLVRHLRGVFSDFGGALLDFVEDVGGVFDGSAELYFPTVGQLAIFHVLSCLAFDGFNGRLFGVGAIGLFLFADSVVGLRANLNDVNVLRDGFSIHQVIH